MENNGKIGSKKAEKRRDLNPKHAPGASHFKIPYVLKRNAGTCSRVFLFPLEENNLPQRLKLYEKINI